LKWVDNTVETCDMNLANKTFIVTGAYSGLGMATARHLHHYNANLVLTDINSDAGQPLAAELNDRSLFITMDVTQQHQIESALDMAKNEFGSMHGLINCAGILVAERLLKKDGSLFELEHFRHCIEVNLIGSFNMIRMVSPLLRDNAADINGERGVIINTASIAAYEGQIGQAAYAASKAGIIGMTLPLARELSQFGIRVMTIAPGVFETAIFSHISELQRQQLVQQMLFPARLGKPSEYAALVQHIIENPMLNGETIRLDGALRLS